MPIQHCHKNSIRVAVVIRCLLTGLFLIIGPVAAIAAISAPGTTIHNQASLSYINSNGSSITLVSNVSTVTVGHYFDFSIDATHSIDSKAGELLAFSHQLINTGNTPDSYFLSAKPITLTNDSQNPDSEDAILLRNPMVYQDTNGNGIVDAGEPELSHTQTLAPGAAVDLVVSVIVPRGVAPDTTFSLEVSVKSTGSAQVAKSVFDTVVVTTGAVIDLQKQTAPSCSIALFPGDTVTHQIEIANSGSSGVDGITLVLDGEITSGIVVEQAVPSNMIFTGFSNKSYATGALPVLKLSGVAGNSWISMDWWDGVSEVASTGLYFRPAQLPPQSVEAFTVEMNVLELEDNAALVTTAATVDLNGDRLADYSSNNTCNIFSVPGAAHHAQLRFLEPAFDVRNNSSLPDFNSGSGFADAVQYSLSHGGATSYHPVRDGAYLELELSDIAGRSGNVKIDATGNRYVVALIESDLTGDSVNVVMLETTTAGIYRSLAPVVLSTVERSEGGFCPQSPDNNVALLPVYDAIPDSCVLASGSDDELQGSYLDSTSGFAIADVALVQPRAMVFNAQTLLPVEGALVSVRLATSNAIAVDMATGNQLRSTTGPDGLYELPRLESGVSYYLHVDPPEAHKFPSVVAPEQLSLFQVSNASYGQTGFGTSGVFTVDRSRIPDLIDIPLDSAIGDVVLSVEKTSAQTDVEPGQVVSYSIAVKNLDEEPVSAIQIEDRPPYGYRYVPMTTTIDGDAVVDPDISSDGTLTFTIGAIDAAETRRLVYSLRATAGAVDSDGVNRALASGINTANAQVVSNESRVRVSLRRDGVLSDRAALFGKIYVDQNCDGIQNHSEWPVGGVRLYLQDGTYTISDADGLFSLYGLKPGSHVIKVDNHTLPQGLELKPLDSNQGVDPESRFVDLMTGDFHRVDFAAFCPQQDIDRIFTEIKARNESINGSWLLKQAEQFRAGEEMQQRDPNSLVRSIDGDVSSGLLDGPVGADNGRETGIAVQKAIALSQENLQPQQQLPVPKEIVASITKAQAKAGTWLWPLDALSIKGRFMAVVRDGIDPTLYVNGEAVSASHIGERMTNRREKAQVVAWYGVELDAGENTVEVKGVGPFGNERVLATGVFKKPSSGTQIKLTAEATTVQADGGRSTLPVKIEVLDSHGYPALGAYFITLENSDGGWIEQDIQDSEPGRQIRVDNGSRVVHYSSSETTGTVTLRASTGEFSDEIAVQQLSESRPLLGVGLLEVGASLSSARFGEFAPSQSLPGLDGKSRLHARGAVFAKGQVKDKYNLTLSYDSDKNSEELLLRDINPSQHYPIHGDASIRGYEAQSRSKLYLKLERDSKSAMWGDYLTDSSSDHEDLARSRRTLTGFNGVASDEKSRLSFFFAAQQDERKYEEVPGNGSAMLYRLQSYPIVSNSEIVELITRSRDNPGLVIARTRLNRFGDYAVDPIEGYLTFSTSVPTVDDQLNPVFVQISYDVERGGDHYLISGVRFDRNITDTLRFGLSHTRDDHSEDGKNLSGVYATYDLDQRTRLSVSAAVSDSIAQGAGTASRVTLDHSWSGDSQARTSFTYAKVDEKFNNSGASVAAGRVETRLNHKQKIKGDSTLILDAVQSDSLVNPEGRRTLSALIESRLREWLVRAGMRQITQEDFNSSDQFVTAIVGVGRNITIGDKVGQFDAELEQDTGRASRQRLTVGAKLQVHEKARVYSNFELSNSLLALTGSSNNQKSEALTLGLETTVLPSTRLYSEYRMRGAFDNRDYETASGIRGDYEIEKDLRVTPSLEIIKTVDGSANNDSVAASVGIVDTRNQNSRRLARVEARNTKTSDYIGFKASYAARMNEDWTTVLTENLALQNNRDGEDTLRHSFVAGFSRRPKLNNRHHMLLMYNWKEEKGLSTNFDRSVHLLSTHQNLQLSDNTILTGRFGGKHHSTRFTGHRDSGFALLADIRLNFDVDRRVNVDLRGGVLASDGTSQMRYSAGASLNYVLNRNARIGVSYNFAGFKDSDLDAEEYNAQGWHVGLQYKFDEESLKWLE